MARGGRRGLVGRAALETGLPAATPVAAGTIDAWSEAFGAGVVAGRYDALLRDDDVYCPRGACGGARPLPLAHRWRRSRSRTVAAGMATSGALTSWFRTIAGDPPSSGFSPRRNGPPGADGLVILPYFAGERTPLFDPNARGVMLGLTFVMGGATSIGHC